MRKRRVVRAEERWIDSVAQDVNRRHWQQQSAEAEALKRARDFNLQADQVWTRLRARLVRAVEIYNSAVVAEETKCWIEFPLQDGRPRSLVIHRTVPGVPRLYVAVNEWTRQIICNGKSFPLLSGNGELRLGRGKRPVPEEEWARLLLMDFLSVFLDRNGRNAPDPERRGEVGGLVAADEADPWNHGR